MTSFHLKIGKKSACAGTQNFAKERGKERHRERKGEGTDKQKTKSILHPKKIEEFPNKLNEE